MTRPYRNSRAGVVQYSQPRPSLADGRPSCLARALGDTIERDPAFWHRSWSAGRSDALAGLSWNPYRYDPVAYASGYHHGERYGA